MQIGFSIATFAILLGFLGQPAAAQESENCPAEFPEDTKQEGARLREVSKSRVEQMAAAALASTPPSSLLATYAARSAAGAEEIAQWWRAQPGYLIEVREAPRPSVVELQAYAEIQAKLPPGTTFTPAATLCPTWTVTVEGIPGALSKADVKAWYDLVKKAPSAQRWKLRGLGVSEPGRDATQ